jgi:hypothetical protein
VVDALYSLLLASTEKIIDLKSAITAFPLQDYPIFLLTFSLRE